MRLLIKYLALFLSWILGCLPKKAQSLLQKYLGLFFFSMCKFRRFTLLRNITIAFPHKSKVERFAIVRSSIINLVGQLFDFLAIPAINKQWMESHVLFHGWEKYQAAAAQGRGVLLMSLHIGSGDLGMQCLALKGIKVNAISKRFRNKLADEFWFGVRERSGIEFIEPHGNKTAFKILSALRRKESVLFVIDQFMGRPYGIETSFFGKKTGTAYGLALFSLKTEAPVIPVFTFRDVLGRINIEFGDEIPRLSGPDRDLQIVKMTENYNRKIEEIIQKWPEQWMWIHRRWKKWE
jgi:KDO2-lipid IV(A) lauroyltransferase